MINYVCLKLKNNEIVFAELSETVDGYYIILHPMSLHSAKDGVFLISWIPYVDDTQFEILVSDTIFVSKLKKSYIKFYGSSRIKEEINKINQRGISRVEDGENPKIVTSEVITEMRNLCDMYANKYGLDPEECKHNFAITETEIDIKSRIFH